MDQINIWHRLTIIRPFHSHIVEDNPQIRMCRVAEEVVHFVDVEAMPLVAHNLIGVRSKRLREMINWLKQHRREMLFP